MNDYYEILEVTRNASTEEIKASYRRLAIRYHPDKNPDDRVAEEQFKRISEAYQILSDTEKRQLYDLYGHSGLAGLDMGGFNGFENIFESFGEMFEEFFNYGRPSSPEAQPQRGTDLRHKVAISLEDVLKGVDASVDIERRVSCNRCTGSGLEPGTQRRKCPRCQGRGKVSQPKGPLKLLHTCPQCQGQGTVIAAPCTACRGTGVVRERKQMQVRIPPGVDQGTRLRLRGEGEAGREGAPPGDLYLEIEMARHPLFTRQENDLHYRAQLSFVEAALGKVITVPTLSSQARLEVPAGTQPGTLLRLPGKGLPGLRGKPRGDLVVEIHLKTPNHLTAQQREVLQEFLRLEEAIDRGELKGRRVGKR